MALYITRHSEESIIVNDQLRITVENIKGGIVKLAFDTLEDAEPLTVMREELWEEMGQTSLPAKRNKVLTLAVA